MFPLFFRDHKRLCDYMIDKARGGEYTVAVLFYKDAMCLLREMAKNDDVTIVGVELKPKEFDGYDLEYYVSMDKDMYVGIEPAFVDDIYLSTEADLTLIDGNAHSSALANVPDDKWREIYIVEGSDFCPCDEEDGTDCCPCELYEDEDEEDDAWDEFFEKAKITKDENGTIIRVDVSTLLKCLFGI